MDRFKDDTGQECFDYSLEERYLLSSLLKMPEYCGVEELKYSACNCVLAKFQTSLVAFGLINKKCIISADTGLGKTIISAALMNCINEKKINMKWIFICPLPAMKQIKSDLDKYMYDSQIRMTSNKEEDIEEIVELSSSEWDVLLVSYEAISNVRLQDYLLRHRNVIKGIVLDESHLLANLDGNASLIINSMCRQMNYVYFLTATPIRVNVGQLIKQVYMLQPEIFGDHELGAIVNRYTLYNMERKPIGVKRLDELKNILTTCYMSYTREYLGIKGKYKTKPILAKYMDKYRDVARSDIFREIKGDPEGSAVESLYQLLKGLNDSGKRGLVYVNLNDNKKMVSEYLAERGIDVVIRDGFFTKTDKQKEDARLKFVNGEVNCMITNLTASLNLPCDYIIFYELTFDFKQFIGRGERGLKPRDLELYFIVVDNTVEVSYFYENVYLRAQMLSLVCDKDVSELEEAYKRVVNRKGDYDYEQEFENDGEDWY